MMEIIKIEPAFVDGRGSIWDLLMNEQIDHIGMLISKKGSIRGKHYHKKQKQYTLVLNGKIRIITKDISKGDSKIERLDLNEMEMVLFPSFCYHSLEALEDSKCIVRVRLRLPSSDIPFTYFVLGDHADRTLQPILKRSCDLVVVFPLCPFLQGPII